MYVTSAVKETRKESQMDTNTVETYVVYEAATTLTVGKREGYKGMGAAKRAIKKLEVLRAGLSQGALLIAEIRDFHQRIEKVETKRNLMSGREFTQPVNTPRCCDPSSELYWSM